MAITNERVNKLKCYTVVWGGYKLPIKYEADEYGCNIVSDDIQDVRFIVGHREMLKFKKELNETYQLMYLDIYESTKIN